MKLYRAGLLFIFLFSCISAKSQNLQTRLAKIDRYAAKIDSNETSYKRVHWKCCDCFGTDKYYSDSATLVKLHNYQSCFKIDFYYKNKKLVLVTIDGSFKRTCGYTEANYCWDSSVVRDYKARIYYENNKLFKEIESGTKPCCEIRPCGGYAGVIDFKNKASVFLKKFGTAKND